MEDYKVTWQLNNILETPSAECKNEIAFTKVASQPRIVIEMSHKADSEHIWKTFLLGA